MSGDDRSPTAGNDNKSTPRPNGAEDSIEGAGKEPEPKPTRKARTFTHDLISVVTSRIAGRACQFFVGVVAARLVGPDGRGLIAALAVAPDLAVSFSQMGMRQSVAYFVGTKTYEVSQIVPTLLTLVISANLIAMAGSLAYFYFTGLIDQSWVLIALALGPIPFFLISNYAAGIFLGKQMIVRFNRVDWIPPALNLLLVICLGWFGGQGVAAIMFATVAAAILSSAYSVYLLCNIAPLRIGFNREIAAKIGRLGMVYGTALFLLLLNYRLPILLLNHYSTFEQVGIYAVGQTLAQIIWEMPAMLSNLVFSRGVNTTESQSAAFADKVVVLTRLVVLIGCLIGAGCIVAAPFAIPMIYGAKFAGSATVLSILLPGTVAFIAFKIIQMDIMRRGHPWISILVVLPCMAANAVLGLWVVPIYGALGAAVLTSATYILATAIYVVVYARLLDRSIGSLILYRKSDFATLLTRLKLKST